MPFVPDSHSTKGSFVPDQTEEKPVDLSTPEGRMAADLPPTAMEDAARGLLAGQPLHGVRGSNIARKVILQGGGAVLGSTVGAAAAPFTGGASVPVLAGAGAAGGNYLSQKIDQYLGLQPKVRPGEVLVSGALGAIPGASAESAGLGGLVREGVKQGLAGAGGKTAETLIDESRLPTPKEYAFATVLPAIGGGAAQKIQSLSPDIQAVLKAAGQTDPEAVRRATLTAMQQRGAVITPSEVNDSGINSVLEGIAGPSKISALAKKANAPVIDEIARSEAGLAPKQPISEQALSDARDALSKPYRDVAALSPQASKDLESWQQLNADSKDAYKAYRANPSPATRKEAESLNTDAEAAFQKLQQHAVNAGKPELASQLAEARVNIAKNFAVLNALNKGSGHVDPAVLGAQYDVIGGKGITGGLKDIGAFQQAFPRDVAELSRVPPTGVSSMDTALGALLAHSAPTEAGGLLSSGIPLIRGPVKSLILSKPYQNLFARLPSPDVNATPDQLAEVIRQLSQAGGQAK